MQGFVGNIEKQTEKNSHFRHVLYTGENLQLVVMTLKPKEEVGLETHEDRDQFFRIEEGEGIVLIDGKEHPIKDGSGIIVPAGAKHNVINTSSTTELKLYTLYSPPEHKDKTVHPTKKDAEEKKEHFDGKTSEGKEKKK